MNGFDPLVNIKILDNEQIAQIMLFIGNTLKKGNIYSIKLQELGYEPNVINKWITNI